MKKSRLRREGIAIFLLLVSLVLHTSVHGGEKGREGALHLRVTSLEGRPVLDLGAEEIQITVGGQAVEVLEVMGPEQPFDIGLLMDVSPSKEAEVDTIRRATADFIARFPLESDILILTFDNEIYLDCDWTTDRKKVDEALWEFGLHKPGNRTILYEAIVGAVDQKFLEHKPRTAMVLFTDGVDTGSEGVEAEASIEFIKGSGVLIYPLQHFSMAHHWKVHYPNADINDIRIGGGGTKVGPIFVGRGSSERDWAEYKINSIKEGAVEYLSQVSKAGGGRFIQLGTIDELGAAYDRVADELTDVYTVLFAPPRMQENEFGTVRVTTTREDVLVSVRPDLFWGAASSGR